MCKNRTIRICYLRYYNTVIIYEFFSKSKITMNITDHRLEGCVIRILLIPNVFEHGCVNLSFRIVKSVGVVIIPYFESNLEIDIEF